MLQMTAFEKLSKMSRAVMTLQERLEWIWVGIFAVVSVAFTALLVAYFAGWL
jgi:hypothetical protein